MSTDALLRTALAAAVPLWIHDLQGTPWDVLQARAPVCAQVIAEHGDDILYASRVKGATAKAFNALAEALAVLSFVPGGVTFLGLHFETPRADE